MLEINEKLTKRSSRRTKNKEEMCLIFKLSVKVVILLFVVGIWSCEWQYYCYYCLSFIFFSICVQRFTYIYHTITTNWRTYIPYTNTEPMGFYLCNTQSTYSQIFIPICELQARRLWCACAIVRLTIRSTNVKVHVCVCAIAVIAVFSGSFTHKHTYTLIYSINSISKLIKFLFVFCFDHCAPNDFEEDREDSI